MADVVNLRLKRKAKKREEAADKAAENLAAFGRSKPEKRLTTALKSQSKKALDGHQREE